MGIPTILDGGTGQLLVDYGHEQVTKDHPMWANHVLDSY
uniref:Serine/threonine protein kinase n=1 Tax=Panagrellus redivivus TaxID=6233 RepID=A0A7E4ZSF2_PANRE